MAFDTQIGSTMNVSKVLAKQNEYIKEHAVRGAGVKSTSVTLKEETSSGNYYNFNVTLDDGSSEVSGVIFCPKGMTGSTGAKGAQGEQGEQGVSVTDVALQIVSSSVEKTKYRIKTTLSNGNEVLTGTFDVYKGEKGNKGDKGDKGDKGESGADGVDGISVTDIQVVPIGSPVGGSQYRFEGTYSDGSELNIGDILIPDGKTPFYTTITPNKNSEYVTIPYNTIPSLFTQNSFDYIKVGTMFVTGNNQLGYVTAVNVNEQTYDGKIYYSNINIFFSSESPNVGFARSASFTPSKLVHSYPVGKNPSKFDMIVFFNGAIGQITTINIDGDTGACLIFGKGDNLGVYTNNVDTPTENEITFPHTNLLDDSGIKIGSTVLFNNCKVGVVKSREIGNPILIKCDIIFDFTPTGILICDSPVEQFVTGAELPIDEVWENRQYVKRGSIIYSSDLTKAASIVSKTDTTYKLGTVKSLVAQTVSNFQFPTTINDEHSIHCMSDDFTIINQGYYSRVESNSSYSGIQTLSTYINIDETSKAFIVPKEGTKYSGFVGVNICPTENTTGGSLRYGNANINVRVVNETGVGVICTVKQSQGYISEIETPALPAGKYSFELDLIIAYGIRTGSVMFSFDVIPFISLQEIK